MFPTEMFESRTQRQVLRVLAEKNRKYTTEELVESCNRSQPTISRAMRHVDRYSFVKKETAPESRRQLYALDSESEYSTPIREFFEVERRRERRDGTVPVDVWNLLEDITSRIERKLDSFIELVLFGSYARGDYYTGSDIDLLLVHSDEDEDTNEIADSVIESLDVDREIQLLIATIEKPVIQRISASGLASQIRELTPVSDTEPLISLSGSVEL